MQTERSSKYTIFLMVILAVQVLLMFFNLTFAMLGEYEHGHSSNIWSFIWNHGRIGLWTLLAVPVSVVAGIIGVAGHKGNKVRCVMSVLSIVSVIPGAFCLLYAIGSQF